jgi:hypothetical protein
MRDRDLNKSLTTFDVKVQWLRYLLSNRIIGAGQVALTHGAPFIEVKQDRGLVGFDQVPPDKYQHAIRMWCKP